MEIPKSSLRPIVVAGQGSGGNPTKLWFLQAKFDTSRPQGGSKTVTRRHFFFGNSMNIYTNSHCSLWVVVVVVGAASSLQGWK